MATLGALTMLVFRLLLGNIYGLDQSLDGLVEAEVIELRALLEALDRQVVGIAVVFVR
ncbi:MAG: hypothetical protein ACRDJS_02675 [Actinomycetota bacterium]